MDKERYIKENKEQKLKEIKEKMNYDDEIMKTINYRLIQDYEVPEWVKFSKKDEEEKIEEEDICGKGMRVRHKVNYRVDFDEDFDSDSEEEIKSVRKKRKRDKEVNSNYDNSSVSYSRKKAKNDNSDNDYSNNLSQIDLNDMKSSSNSNGGFNNKVKIQLGDDNIIKIEDESDEDIHNHQSSNMDEEIVSNDHLSNLHHEDSDT